jgi:Sec-independent protein translocase protein TatA
VFGLGFWEIAVVMLLAVMLFPPKELPKLARSVARTYGTLKRTAEDFRNTVMHDEDLRQPLDEIRGAYNDARWQVRDMERQARVELAKARTEARLAAESLDGRSPAAPPTQASVAVGDPDDEEDDDIDAEAFYTGSDDDDVDNEDSDGGPGFEDAPQLASASVPALPPLPAPSKVSAGDDSREEGAA